MRYLVKSVNTWVIPSVEEVEKFHEELLQDNNYQLTSFGYKTKQIKAKGEVVEEYQVVTETRVFNEEKNPDTFVEVGYEVG
jgi:hypothetical protein